MSDKKEAEEARALARAGQQRAEANYVLRLFVAGITPKSELAIRAVKDICEEHLKGRYELEIVDMYKQPQSLRDDQVIVAPTLIKKLPLPLRRMIGSMADTEKVLVGLDLRPRNAS